MKNIYVTIDELFPKGLTELYVDIHNQAQALDIPYLVVGAMARDLVLVHGFGANIERATRDIDFGICVESWEQYQQLSDHLVSKGFKKDSKVGHKFCRRCSDGCLWELDIVPFGDVAVNNNIAWPPAGEFVMNVLGFQEALENAWLVEINAEPKVAITVCSPVGISLLKLVAWFDRESAKRKKDASDFLYVIDTYKKIADVYDALYDEGFMENADYDDLKATASKIGSDASSIASQDTIDFLKSHLFEKEDVMETLAREMYQGSKFTYEEAFECLSCYSKFF